VRHSFHRFTASFQFHSNPPVPVSCQFSPCFAARAGLATLQDPQDSLGRRVG
jgi:hypothetical protein